MWVKLGDNGKIKQIAIGFKEPPFGNALEAPGEVLKKPDCWRYENEKFVYYPKVGVQIIPDGLVATNEIITIKAQAENGEGEMALLIIDDEIKDEKPIQAEWQVAFDTPGVYRVCVKTQKYGSVIKEVMVR